LAKLSVRTWIGHAAAVLCGRHGASTTPAQHAGCSRPTAYDHAPRVHQAGAEVHAGGSTRAPLLHDGAYLRDENRPLGDALEETSAFPKARPQRGAVSAAALGLRDRQITLLLTLLWAARAPSRAPVGRWVQPWAPRAGRVLQPLDAWCVPWVRTLCGPGLAPLVAGAAGDRRCRHRLTHGAGLPPDWLVRYRRGARGLRRTLRASSVVECMNSVWRMQQARHRGRSPALLDLKRLWWTSRAFSAGKRRGQCPYRLLGLRLPTYDPWALLQWEPDQLAQQLATADLAA
jgi:hypothetical protein